jgi:ABC-type Na+ efflux pump permease subunit
MNSFINNLNKREKYLIFLALAAILIFFLFSISSNLISSVNSSNKQLAKVKNDYEYVVAKIEALNQSLVNSKLNITDISSFLQNEKSNLVINSEVLKEEDYLKINFVTKNFQDSIAISDEVSAKLNMNLKMVEYTKIDNQSQTILYFN